tara:strand:+ start:156 stop:1130 length:975 start_codon:yes stop_codon:yes gene_type:complete
MELSDEAILETISSNSSTFRDLVYIIYSKFDELDSILHLFNITNFKISHMQEYLPPSFYDEKYTLIRETMYTYRASVISRGTKIIFDRYGVILSNLLTLIYFFVEYLRKNGIELTEDTKFPTDDRDASYKYINNYMPLPPVILYLMVTPLKLFNTIDDHVVSGGRSIHFFISSSDKSPTPGYLARSVQTASSEYIPVIITIKISPENPAFKSYSEDDHVISPILKGEFIETINRIEGTPGDFKIGEEINLKTMSIQLPLSSSGGAAGEAGSRAGQPDQRADAVQSAGGGIKLKGNRNKKYKKRKKSKKKSKRRRKSKTNKRVRR